VWWLLPCPLPPGGGRWGGVDWFAFVDYICGKIFTMEKMLETIREIVPQENLKFVFDDATVIQKAKEFNLFAQMAKTISARKAKNAHAFCMRPDGNLYIFSAFQGHNDHSENGYALIIVEKPMPEVLIKIFLSGFLSAENIDMI
jgi:hypothetical protein